MTLQKKIIAKTLGGDNAVDASMLDWLEQLNSETAEPSTFEQVVRSHLHQLSSNLSELQTRVASDDFSRLETLALEISHNSLKIGAINMLKAAFDLQNVARLKASSEAQQLALQIESEYKRVQASFENVV